MTALLQPELQAREARRPPEQLAFEAALRANLRERARLMTGLQADAARLLRNAAGAMAALLAQQPAEWQQLQLAAVQSQVQALLDGLQGDLTTQVDKGLLQAWATGQAGVDAPLAAAGIHVDIFMPQLDATLLTAMRSFTAGRIKDLAAEAGGKIDQALHLAVLGAQTPGQAIKTVQAELGAKDATTLKRARKIVVTSLGEAYAVASQQRQEQAAERVPDLQKEWLRSGKIHSRWNHDAMDGVVVPVKDPFLVPTKGAGAFIKMMHPHDPKAPPAEVINCGCVARPRLARWGMPSGAKAFSEREIALNPLKKAGAAWVAGKLANKR